jgi:crossover junction endodeoxyribonuclease RusA
MDYKFDLPWPPSVNGYWRSFRGRQIISKKGREYRKDILLLLSDMALSGENLKGRLAVSIALHPPTLRKYDIDNWCKAPFDALTHAEFWLDDEQIDKLSISKAEKTKYGKITFNVRELAPCG